MTLSPVLDDGLAVEASSPHGGRLVHQTLETLAQLVGFRLQRSALLFAALLNRVLQTGCALLQVLELGLDLAGDLTLAAA